MRWGQWITGAHNLPSNMEMVYHPILPYLITVSMHTMLPSFLGLSTHIPQLGILFFPSYYSLLPSYMCPTSYLPPLFWMMASLQLSDDLGFGISGLLYPSITPGY